MPSSVYRGRLAPSPTGYLHLGHARTFWIAQERARIHNGVLILRNEDLDSVRCRPEFVSAVLADLKWFGLNWTEGPDCGGNLGPYNQSARLPHYQTALEILQSKGFLYPCKCSRKDIAAAARAPHDEDDNEPIYPGTCRPPVATVPLLRPPVRPNQATNLHGRNSSLRFLVPDGERISFYDENLGEQTFVAGRDFGDFIIWRPDNTPAYQLACVVDDAAMKITEVVRGADLLKSTARQLLLYRALGLTAPRFFHCPLMTDRSGQRLAKRHEALSLRRLKTDGASPEALRREWNQINRTEVSPESDL